MTFFVTVYFRKIFLTAPLQKFFSFNPPPTPPGILVHHVLLLKFCIKHLPPPPTTTTHTPTPGICNELPRGGYGYLLEVHIFNCLCLLISVCFLLSLVDHEEIGELDLSDLVNNNKSVFATLFANEENMKVWPLLA